MSRPRKYILSSIEKLSPAGRQVVDTLLAKDATYAAIVRELRNKTGEKISDTTLGRYRARIWVKPDRKQDIQFSRRMLAELLVVAVEIRDALRALGARQLRAVPKDHESLKGKI